MQEIATKATGDQLTATEFNNIPDELENAITDTGITLSGADRHQLSKAISNYVSSGDYYVDSGAAGAYVLGVIGSKEAPTELFDGFRARFRVANTNTGVSTVNVVALGVKSIKKYGGLFDLEEGDIKQGNVVELSYVSSLDVFELVTIEDPILREAIPLIRPISGCLPANNGAAPATDVDVSAGFWRSTTSFDVFTLAAILTKRMIANWVEGTNQGGFPSLLTLTNNRWYHVFLIAKDDGTIDGGFDSDINAGNLLADATGYTHYRRVGGVRYLTADIKRFQAFEDVYTGRRDFFWADTDIATIAAVIAIGTLHTILTPLDIQTLAHLHAYAAAPSGAASGTAEIYIYPSFKNDPSSVGGGNNTIASELKTTSLLFSSGNDFSIYSDTNSQIKYYAQLTGGVTAVNFDLGLEGYTELQ